MLWSSNDVTQQGSRPKTKLGPVDTPPSHYISWAKLLRTRIPGDVSVTRFYDNFHENAIAIFESKQPEGIVAATIGLMDIDQRVGAGPVHTEVLMDQLGQDPRIGNVLATLAFYIAKDGWRVRPGTVFENVVRINVSEARLPHVYFTTPFQWQDFSAVDLDGRKVHPLVAVPVSEAEADLARKEQGRVLELLWESKGTNVLDWNRSSAL